MIRLLFAAVLLLALLLATFVGASATPSVAAAQGAGFGVRFFGTVRLSGEFAPAGAAMTVYQGQAYRDVKACGTGTVSGSGQWQVDVPAIEGCGRSRTSPCCHFTFVLHDIPGQPGVRENIGGCSCGSFDLDRPQTWGRSVQQGGSAVRLPGSPSDSSDPLPAVWFHGLARLAGRPAPIGTEIQATQSRQGTVHDCGTGTVTTEDGGYALAVPAQPGCAEDTGSPCCAFTFFIAGEKVGGCSCGVARFRTFQSFGGQVRLDLSGQTAPAPSPPPASGPSTLSVDPSDPDLALLVDDCLRRFAKGTAFAAETAYTLTGPVGPSSAGRRLLIRRAASGAGNRSGPAIAGGAILRPDGTPGPGSDAIIELDPTNPPYHDAVAGNPPTDRDLCAGLVHELVHVADIWNGAWDLTSVEPLDWVDPETGNVVATDGSGILRRELQAMQEENCYRLQNGLATRRIYPWQQPDHSIRLFLLPVDAIFPPYCSP